MIVESDRKVFRLSQVCQAIENTVNSISAAKNIWIKAEISTITFQQTSGHLYLELLEEQHGKKLAVIKGTIWKSKLSRIKEVLDKDFNNVLKRGSEIVFLGEVTYNKVFGISLNIHEIDLSFNIGALEIRKQQTIKRLQEEGLIGKNKLIKTPLMIQRIALIAAKDSAAYNDFMQHIKTNEHNYRIVVHLFESTVQGEDAPKQLLNALNRIDVSNFDIVAFIRGGGSKLDLDCFNNYDLCAAIANFKLPIWTGIGHETDISVADIVSSHETKTPTDLADAIIDRLVNFEKKIYDIYIRISRDAVKIINNQNQLLTVYLQKLKKDPVTRCQQLRGDLHKLTSLLYRHTQEFLKKKSEDLQKSRFSIEISAIEKIKSIESRKLNEIKLNLAHQVKSKFLDEKNKLNNLDTSLRLLSPINTLSRGYTITRLLNGKQLKLNELSPGIEIETISKEGKIVSVIKKIQKDGKG